MSQCINCGRHTAAESVLCFDCSDQALANYEASQAVVEIPEDENGEFADDGEFADEFMDGFDSYRQENISQG